MIKFSLTFIFCAEKLRELKKQADEAKEKKLEVDPKTNFTKEDINKKNQNGQNALIIAIMSGKPEMVKFLIKEHDADVNVRTDKKGDTALHLAFRLAAKNKRPS